MVLWFGWHDIGWKRAHLAARPHLSNVSTLFLSDSTFPTRTSTRVYATRALSKPSLLPRESRGLFFSSRSIVWPSRFGLFFLFFLFSLSSFLPSSGAQFECIMPGETMAQRSWRAHAPGRISRGTAGANFAVIFTVSVVEKSLKRRTSGVKKRVPLSFRHLNHLIIFICS